MNVRTLCLGILSFAQMTGYDIRKLAAEGNFSHFCEANYGSIYPALSQLTKDGFVVFTDEVLDGKPPRKIYSITEKGRVHLFETLNKQPGPDRFKSEFLFYSLFQDKMPVCDFRKLLVRKIAETRDTLESLEKANDCCDHEPSLFALGYGVAMNKAVLDYLKKYAAEGNYVLMVTHSKHAAETADKIIKIKNLI